MNVYQDVTLLPEADIDLHFLWKKVYQQVHIALVENKNSDGSSSVGITFPGYSNSKKCRGLGNKLRLFAPDQEVLAKLDINRWLERMTDYVHITSARPVPDKVEKYVRTVRQQIKSNANLERLARRASKRQNVSYEQALEERAKLQPQHIETPYIWVNSQSNKQRFRLFIVQEITEQKGVSVFTSYGLTKEGALPLF